MTKEACFQCNHGYMFQTNSIHSLSTCGEEQRWIDPGLCLGEYIHSTSQFRCRDVERWMEPGLLVLCGMSEICLKLKVLAKIDFIVFF